ncbi:bet V I allergen [Fusarium tjaetaba]|uniref:Bet V I allergen n=1 Tax=Fusarium tjaetaba TaxID=1567544 RepID=A0A8H5VYI3_9HYPO|nr:bet V I allergen [Fusarium tjaetaba]KAF5642272.1 bet V I allergen [Fusarium tjaetaba]
MSRALIYTLKRELDHDIEEVWSIISKFDQVAAWSPVVAQCTTKGEGIGSVRYAVTDSGVEFNEKLEILDHESHIISYSFEEPVPLQVTGLSGTQHLEAIEPGKTRLTWIAEADSLDEEVKAEFTQLTQDLVKASVAGLAEVLEKRQGGASN